MFHKLCRREFCKHKVFLLFIWKQSHLDRLGFGRSEDFVQLLVQVCPSAGKQRFFTPQIVLRKKNIQKSFRKNKKHSIFKSKKRLRDEFGFHQVFDNKLTSSENKMLQRVFLLDSESDTYMLCCTRGNVKCIFFVDETAVKTSSFCKELGEFIVPQMDWLGNVLREPASKNKNETQNNYIYFNNMNLAIKSSIQSDELPRHVMSTIQTMHQDFEKSDQKIVEVVIKNSEDTWVVGKRVDERELFVYFDLHRVSLLDISEEVKRLSSSQLGNIFID